MVLQFLQFMIIPVSRFPIVFVVLPYLQTTQNPLLLNRKPVHFLLSLSRCGRLYHFVDNFLFQTLRNGANGICGGLQRDETICASLGAADDQSHDIGDCGRGVNVEFYARRKLPLVDARVV